jgi:hypothetical protein
MNKHPNQNTPRRIDPVRMAEWVREGVPIKEIARRFGASEGGCRKVRIQLFGKRYGVAEKLPPVTEAEQDLLVLYSLSGVRKFFADKRTSIKSLQRYNLEFGEFVWPVYRDLAKMSAAGKITTPLASCSGSAGAGGTPSTRCGS